MLSRVADSIYWMARYVERAENHSRLLLSTQDLLLDAGSAGANSTEFWTPILMTTGDEDAYHAVFPSVEAKSVIHFLTSHPGNPNSIANCIRAARENARTIRDQISDELWDCINSMRLYVESPPDEQQGAGFFERILRGSYEFQGVAASTTPRGENWHFLRLGTCLERADKTSRLLDTCTQLSLEMPPHPEAKPLRWAALLRSCSAWHAFQVHSARLDPTKVVEYLLLKESFPRSVACNVAEVHQTLRSLCNQRAQDTLHEPVRLAGRLRADLVYTKVTEILGAGLHDYIDQLQTRLNDIGTAIFEAFILYSDTKDAEEPATLQQPTTFGAWHISLAQEAEMQRQQQQ